MSRYLLLAIAVVATAPAHARMFAKGGDAFENADTNKDGIITRAEYIANRNGRFSKMDRNGDGVVSTSDFGRLAKFKPEAAQRLNAMISQVDGNGDGKVTAAELAAAPVPIFDRVDTNQDGSVDAAERAAGKEAMAAFRDRGK